MPITIHIDHQNSVVFATAKEIVTLHDILRHLREKEALGVSHYSQLFDAIDVQLDLSVGDLVKIGREVRHVMRGRTMPKVAVVTDSFYILALAMTYSGITKAENPNFKVFKSLSKAKAWLSERARTKRAPSARGEPRERIAAEPSGRSI